MIGAASFEVERFPCVLTHRPALHLAGAKHTARKSCKERISDEILPKPPHMSLVSDLQTRGLRPPRCSPEIGFTLLIEQKCVAKL